MGQSSVSNTYPTHLTSYCLQLFWALSHSSISDLMQCSLLVLFSHLEFLDLLMVRQQSCLSYPWQIYCLFFGLFYFLCVQGLYIERPVFLSYGVLLVRQKLAHYNFNLFPRVVGNIVFLYVFVPVSSIDSHMQSCYIIIILVVHSFVQTGQYISTFEITFQFT